MGEDGGTVALNMLVEAHGFGQHTSKRGLAHFQRITRRKSSPFSSMRSKAVEEYAPVSALVPDEIERGNAVLVASNRLAIDDAGARAQPGRRTVNTEPLPCSLVTVTSPPIMRASLREMARPSPVPP